VRDRGDRRGGGRVVVKSVERGGVGEEGGGGGGGERGKGGEGKEGG